MEADELKIWVFYLKKSEEPYAWTATKEYKDIFLTQRNPKCFKVDKMILDEFEFSLFANKYSNLKLSLSDFGVNNEDPEFIKIACTMKEEYQLEAFCAKIDALMEDARDTLYYANLKKEFHNASNTLTDISYNYEYPSGGEGLISRINMIYVISKLFEETFNEKRCKPNEFSELIRSLSYY